MNTHYVKDVLHDVKGIRPLRVGTIKRKNGDNIGRALFIGIYEGEIKDVTRAIAEGASLRVDKWGNAIVDLPLGRVVEKVREIVPLFQLW